MLLRHFDLVLLAAALPLFIGADLPMVGYAAVAIAWVGQRALQYLLTRRAKAVGDPRRETGILVASMLTRSFVLAAAIVVAGITEREAGLAAALLAVVVFTAYFFITLVRGALEAPRRPTS